MAVSLLMGTACAPDPPSAVVGIVVDPCGPGQEGGSGMIVAPGVALTAAHVVAGADEIIVQHGGREAVATVSGFDPEMVTKGFGLLSVSERVDLLGGTLEIASQEGSGTRTTLRLP